VGRFGGVNRLFSRRRRRRRVWPTVSVFGSTPIILDDSIVTGFVGGSAPRFCARSPTPCHHFIFILKSFFLLQQHVASADAAGVNGHEEG
jgi:hypothetical protein